MVFSALLHWLKELGFEAPDPSLFGQLVQVSGDRSQFGVWIGCVHACKEKGRCALSLPFACGGGGGGHFKKDFAAASFSGPHVFDDEVLAKVIVASREDSHLDAQLSIAKAFTLPVFCTEAKSTGRKASSGQGSSAAAASTLSPALNAVAQRILRWAERLNISLIPQFVPGRNNVVADALSRPDQVLGSEWSSIGMCSVGSASVGQ